MALNDIVKSVKSTGRNLGKYLAVTAALGSSYFAGTKAYADKFVDNSMSYTDINNTIASAVSGEDVHFAAGTYQLPQVQGAKFYLNNQGVDLVADGSVILRGATVTSGTTLRIDSINSGSYGFIMENAQHGVTLDANFDPSNPIIIQGNTIQNVETGIKWTNKDVFGPNSLPSVIVDSNYIRAVFAGGIFDESSGTAVNDQKAWAQVSNNTFEQISGVVYSPPLYTVGSVASGQNIVLGLGSFGGNINIDMNGVTVPNNVLTGTPGPILGSQGRVASAGVPSRNGEMNIANNPAPGYLWNGQYLSDVWPAGNNVASEDSNDAKVTWSRRPLFGSPFIGDGKCVTVNGSERHYCGAFAPFGDSNNDGTVNDVDQNAMLIALDKERNGEQLSDIEKQVFWVNSNGPIDVAEFYKLYQGNNQAIPTVSTWGAGILALLTLTAGTLVYQGRERKRLA